MFCGQLQHSTQRMGMWMPLRALFAQTDRVKCWSGGSLPAVRTSIGKQSVRKRDRVVAGHSRGTVVGVTTRAGDSLKGANAVVADPEHAWGLGIALAF
jgi:hypothetical protein